MLAPVFPRDADRLFGLFVLRNEAIPATGFAQAYSDWAAAPSSSFADWLTARGLLSSQDREAVDHLVSRRVARSGGDDFAAFDAAASPAERSLMAAPLRPEETAAHHSAVETDDPLRTHLQEAQAEGSSESLRLRSLPRYELTRLHAAGGMGQVWIARDPDLGREVALKELRTERRGQRAAEARFIREARVTGRLEHPNIVPVHELCPGDEARSPYYTMRLLPGRTLAEATRDYHTRRVAGQTTAADLRTLLGAFVGVCQAVAFAHSRGVIHRDLKGANVALGEFGEVVLLDWGLAKAAGETDGDADPIEGDVDASVAGQVVGTPAFMPPEQAAGRTDEVGPLSDVYGLGAVLYEVLTGSPPFTGHNAASVIVKVLTELPETPRTVVPGTPRPLEAVCLKALAKQPADRYPSATALLADVQRYLADEPVSADREPLLERVGRRIRRNRTLAAAVAVAAGVLIPGLGAFAEVERRNNAQLTFEQGQTTTAKNLAESRLTDATDAWYAQVVDVQNEFLARGVSARLRRHLLETARGKMLDLFRDTEPTAKTDHMLFSLHRWLALVNLDLGDLNTSEREWAEANRIAEERLKAEPDGPDSKRDAAHSLVMRGMIHERRGDLPGAAEDFQTAEKLYAAHAVVRPDDARLPEDRIELARQRGDLLRRLGKADDARATHRAGWEMARSLSDARPGDRSVLRRRYVLAMRSGDDALVAGDLSAAWAAFKDALSTVGELETLDPSDELLSGDRAKALSELGAVYAAKRHVLFAEFTYQKALTILRELSSRPSAAAEAMRTLMSLCERTGDLHYDLGRYVDALKLYDEQVKVARKLARDPLVSSVADLAKGLYRLGNCRGSLGDVRTAVDTLEECRTLWEQVLATRTKDTEVIALLASTHTSLGFLTRQPPVLDFERSHRHYLKSVELLRNMRATGQLDGRPDWQEKLATAEAGVQYTRDVLAVIDDINAGPEDSSKAFPLLIARARVMAKRGNAAETGITARSIFELNPEGAVYVAGAARGCALAAGVATPAEKEQFAAQAIKLLAEAIRLGWKGAAGLLSDPDFASVRERPEFRELVAPNRP